MTITGKCDVCRMRKVKCDQRRPKCGACSKRDRPCSYSYGQVTAFVAEDPTQLSKQGKPMKAPVIYPVVTWETTDLGSFDTSSVSSKTSSSEDLRLTTERGADDGKGVFLTLAIASKDKPKGIRKPTPQQRKKLENHLNRLRELAHLTSYRPSSPESTLAARYLSILGPQPLKHQSLAMLGSWIETIPSRIGSSAVVDLAVEYLINSVSVLCNDSFSNRRVALASKARALKQLQLIVSNETTRATYDTALAMKMHFVAEICMGLKSLHHVIHAVALVEMLRAGPPSGLDVDHYWNFLDNTYIDDVPEAMVAGRTSVFDNEFYLETSSPATIPVDAPDAFRASVTIMHIFIQIPRLVCLVRHVKEHPEDTEMLASAVCLAESLWLLDPFDIMERVLQSSTTTIPIPPGLEIADIVSDSFHFDSIESACLISRYWMMKINLCGVTERLLLHFPKYTANTLLPDLVTVQRDDVHTAMNLARCIQYALYTCPHLPLLPLRIHTTVQISLGSWYRLYLRLSRAQEALNSTPSAHEDIGLTAQIERALRMKTWITDECNRLNKTWGIDAVSDGYLIAAVEHMTGGPIPDWLPTTVTFEEQDGDTVMKVEYGIPGPRFEELFGKDDERLSWLRSSTTASPFGKTRPVKALSALPEGHYEMIMPN
ncbi:hypothetical protein K458DRAFT_422755 [Lentithecium fluviatile CBS 122367]|uniref:Zn(2)-C6 fungal-type domain-containing protein n=1 Tax=Lentithecium fluviatile CBS 122367 TaxID=1168545 RepID=A0A6G1ILW6_9PLEO|nr:hypothetical protein K458DRAFT_422755 [Lentithecium fluviatile CBS 122367]